MPCISVPPDSLPAGPKPSRHQKPIGQREDEPLHEVELISWLFLVAVESFIDFAVKLELSQHQPQFPYEERATCVAGVAAWKFGYCGVFAHCHEIATLLEFYSWRTSDWEKTAAAVLEFGTLVQSPMPQMLAYLVWRIEFLSQSRYPAASAKPD